MILLTVNFGFHVIAIFMIYKNFSRDSWFHVDDFDVQLNNINLAIGIIWHSYYSSVSLLVIISGALLSKHVSEP